MKEQIDSIKEKYKYFKNELDNKIKDNNISIYNNTQCYAINESWINEFNRSSTLPRKNPEFLNDISSLINCLKGRKNFSLTNIELMNFIFKTNKNELNKNSLFKYYTGNNKIIIENKSNNEKIGLLLIDPLGKYIFKNAFIINYNSDREKTYRFRKLLNEFNGELDDTEFNNYAQTIDDYIKKQNINDKTQENNYPRYNPNSYTQKSKKSQCLEQNNNTKDEKDKNLVGYSQRTIHSSNQSNSNNKMLNTSATNITISKKLYISTEQNNNINNSYSVLKEDQEEKSNKIKYQKRGINNSKYRISTNEKEKSNKLHTIGEEPKKYREREINENKLENDLQKEKKLSSELNLENKNLKNKIQELEKQNKQIDKLKNDINNQKNKIEELLNKKEKDLDNIKNELNEKDVEINELKKEKIQIEKELIEEKNKLKKLENEKDKKNKREKNERDIREKENKYIINQKDKEIDNLKQKINEIQKNLDNEENYNNEIIEENKKLKNNEKENLKIIKEKEKIISNLEKENNDLKIQNTNLDNELGDIYKENDNDKEQINQLKKDEKKYKDEKLKSENKINNLENEIENLKKQNSDLNKELEEIYRENDNDKEEIKELKDKENKYLKEIKENEKKINILEKENQNLINENTKIKNELDEVYQQNDELINENNNLKKDFKKNEKNYDLQEEKLKKRELELSKRENDFNKKLSYLDDREKMLENELESLSRDKEENERIKKDNIALINKNKEIENQIKVNQIKLDQLKSKIDNQSKQNIQKEMNPKKIINKINLSSSISLNPMPEFDKPTLVGLNNIGATCFMNATLQCLSQTYLLTNYFLHNRDRIYNNNLSKQNPNSLQLCPVYYELLKELWSKDGKKSVSPNDFMNTVEQMNSLFKKGQAGDSKDFIIFILEQFHKELKKSVKNKNEVESTPLNQYDKNNALNYFFNEFQQECSIISDIFFGFTETTNECMNCKNIYSSQNRQNPICYNYGNFNCLIFPLEEVKNMKNKMNINNSIQMYNNNSVSIYECFYYYQKSEYFTGQNQNYCNLCKKLCDSIYTCRIFSSPQILILILNRGRGNIYNVKLDFNEEIDITQFVLQKDTPQLTYNLYGVITHIGKSGPDAHFIASCKSPINNRWYRYNDAIVSPITNVQNEVIDFGTPYILFYQRN